MKLKGIHHVSSLTANARQNLDFYTRILGLRLVKKTVNQDNPSYYHLFYGDEKGNPGTGLSFFEIPNMARKHPGTNSISGMSFRVKTDDALEYWKNRFEELGVRYNPITERFGHAVLPFRDSEDHEMVLVSDQNNKGTAPGKAWTGAGIPEEYGITGLGPVMLSVRYLEPTVQVLTELMGYRPSGEYRTDEKPSRLVHVFETGEGGNGSELHVQQRKDLPDERQGRGSVHHVAFRVDTEEELLEWVRHLEADGFKTSGFVDRYYFKSLYVTEPNGILFELATDGPGFDQDEPIHELGERLSLPTFLEDRRKEIEAHLKPLPSTIKGRSE
ncbi:ring-cleaving dioxygenase [Bacillus sp. AFS015802]|uniref:ring-cleaving dioxygenase n=1 Tax=Bacillus sp. AFS015802 TaxID=2033486 RepID=UPI000BF88129|nr:ring-cleaving dioxygenase [Bacillus sp. AFS015802]PFA63004.1 ring-cleaving dioxygenase [Bacillus sp. AFS015802]